MVGKQYSVLSYLLYTFQVILLRVPIEIVWSATVSWYAGDVVCRVMVFLRFIIILFQHKKNALYIDITYTNFRIIGFYASGFIMIVISLDRLSAIMFPISHISSTKRTKMMLIIAWMMAPICSLPQVYKQLQKPIQIAFYVSASSSLSKGIL